ncbi:peptidase inhibitor family I36 protein [Nonomuraea insulae]|uniref:Peptidase inhibitor family I36 protein n=1 Tax=Nonomuraea insulae TaxID=1616787 RepID=A0ABW1CGZ7_9ACTN
MPASATVLTDVLAHGSGSCPANYVCLWIEGDFVRGALHHKFGSVAANQDVTDMGKLQWDSVEWKGMQDLASSVVNTGSHICCYEHNSYGGLEFEIGPWERLPAVPGWINDKISSFKYC